MAYSTFELISLINIIGSILGGVVVLIFKKINSEDYIKKYSKFKKALETHFDSKMRKEIIDLVKDKSLTLEKFQTNFSNKLSKLLIVQDMRKEYLKLKSILNKAFLFFLIIFILSLVNFLFQDFMIFNMSLFKIDLIFLIIGLIWVGVIYWNLSKLERYMDRFHFGEPINDILEERLLKEYFTES